ncbi:membrane protein insertion efficiency factor YidD, partial [bacterium]|nr:membrane protein insertion efficiency factor YidD [bacterium]
KGYQFIVSPLFPGICRYYPTCSSYALEAVNKYGALKGGAMAVKRVLTCNALFPGGYDPLK